MLSGIMYQSPTLLPPWLFLLSAIKENNEISCNLIKKASDTPRMRLACMKTQPSINTPRGTTARKCVLMVPGLRLGEIIILFFCRGILMYLHETLSWCYHKRHFKGFDTTLVLHEFFNLSFLFLFLPSKMSLLSLLCYILSSGVWP